MTYLLQVKVLDETTKALSKSLDAAPELRDLPGSVEELKRVRFMFMDKRCITFAGQIYGVFLHTQEIKTIFYTFNYLVFIFPNVLQQIAGFGSQMNNIQQSIGSLTTFQTNTEKILAALQASQKEVKHLCFFKGIHDDLHVYYLFTFSKISASRKALTKFTELHRGVDHY